MCSISEAAARDCVAEWYPQSHRISTTVTDALVRGAALAVMLLACSRVSDVLVRCPAVELMVLAC